jgi:lipoprotein-releasing system permease protein
MRYYELFLAFRYIRSRPKHRLARVTIVVGILGITCGVAALIVALSLANGFRDEMRDKILTGTSHITITRKDGGEIFNYDDLQTRIEVVTNIVSVSPTTYDGALLDGPNSSAYGILRGVDPTSKHVIENIKRTIIKGSVDALLKNEEKNRDDGLVNVPKAIIGSDLASRLGVEVGEIARVVSAGSVINAGDKEPRARKIEIAGIFRSGLYEYDTSWVYIGLSSIADLAKKVPFASMMSVEIKSIDDAPKIATLIRDRLGDEFSVVTWQEANQQLFAALKLERRVIVSIIMLIVLIAALNISTTLILMVVERRSDIAILRTLGASVRSIMLLFLIEGGTIGIVGAGGGVIFGLLLSYLGDRLKLVSLPADVYSISFVPFHIEPMEVLLVALLAFILSLIATIYPARVASRLRPVEILKNE